MLVGIDGRELHGRPTGTGRYLRSLLHAWTSSTDDRFTLYFNGAAPALPALQHPRVRPRGLGAAAVRGLRWQEARLPAAVRQDQPDVFFAPAYTCPLRLRLPRVTMVHDLSFFAVPHDFSLLDGLRRRLLVGASLRASTAVLVPSEFTRREILARFPELDGRIHVTPHGRDDDLPPAPARADARRRLGIAGPLLLTVGSVLNRRRLPVLLRAVTRLAVAWPGITADVVGDNRTHPRLDLEAIVAELGLDGRVRLSGFVDEAGLADRYSAADVVVYLSEYEGFGLPALEAICRGVPVVLARRPALSEVFAGAAAFAEPDDIEEIAAAVDRVLRDRGHRSALVESGHALARRFSWAETAARTRDLLARAAGQ
jgi:glycosyltransferase involved in cell wall biosynthesis